MSSENFNYIFNLLYYSLILHFYFYLGFLLRTFTNRKTAREGGGRFFNSSLPLPPTSQTLRHQPGNYSTCSSRYQMTVSLVQWRALIGIFNCRISVTSTTNRYYLTRKFVSMLENLLLFYHYLEGMYTTVITLLYIFVPLL